MADTSIDIIDPKGFFAALKGGGEYLKKNYRILDNLNVFPVPDGDTGTNMLATFNAGIERLTEEGTEKGSIEEICGIMDHELLHESRGNSGFIISRFFHGFFQTVSGTDSVTAGQITEGFENGLFTVKTALLKPVEGTMITIISAMTEWMLSERTLQKKNGITEFLGQALKAGEDALKETPKMLPILKKAGVVDSGALGFIFLMRGIIGGLSGSEPGTEDEANYRFEPQSVEADTPADRKGYRFCTEIVVEKDHSRPVEGLKEYLSDRGDSIALVDEDVLKLHIHTDNPDDIIGFVSGYGKIVSKKIDDMDEQVSLISGDTGAGMECTVLCFIPGPGFADIFSGFGVSSFILYRDELPSTREILEEIDLIENRNIIILPNNRNILPSVRLAKEKSGKNISIVPTVNVIEGITSMYGFSENEGMADNVNSMMEYTDTADALFVYRSTEDKIFEGVEIKKGSFFALSGKTIASAGDDPAETIIKAAAPLITKETGMVTLYCKELPDNKTEEKIRNALSASNEFLEFEFLKTEQFREEYIISIE